ncbi:RNA-binding domain-containing protein [Staphylococcus simulans]|uniref:RNA-binding domain-containing protein n=1 Tax=Staphylococcus simulans TaxID=1286 RepID=UPI00399C0DE8
MKVTAQIIEMLDDLDHCIADELEQQDLDFKKWNERSFNDNVRTMVDYAVCMANGGGGSVVFGVTDKVLGKAEAITGIKDDTDIDFLIKKVYHSTDPHLTPSFDKVAISIDGKLRTILIMHIYPDNPPYTKSDGAATIRQGKDCLPFTGSLRRKMIDTTCKIDYSEELIHEDWHTIISATAMEIIREFMTKEQVDNELLMLSDEQLLTAIGGLKNGYMTKGALLLTGKPQAIEKYVPEYKWSYRRMLSDTEYSIREDSTSAIPVALQEFERFINTDNPIVTVETGMIHAEFKTYPTIALREALLNAFGHRDYRLIGHIMIKQYKDKIILTNPGEFIGGITSENILHHPPVARNNHLMELLDRLRLVNRSNIGVSRIFKSLLLEGKEPPIYREVGNHIELTFLSSTLNTEFIDYIKHLNKQGKQVDIDHLLVLQYLIRHEEITTDTVAKLIQRNHIQAKEVMGYMKTNLSVIESIGRGKGRYYTLNKESYTHLKDDVNYDRQSELDKERVKMRLLSILAERPLTNKEIRIITGLDVKQVQRLLKELKQDGVYVVGRGRGAKYQLRKDR